MELSPYVDRLRHDLATVAESGGPEARSTAERLAAALDSAVRMAMLEALSDAAAEVTAGMAGGAVDVRMKGREPQLVVSAAVGPEPGERDPAGEPAADDDVDTGALARITVRIPEAIKARAEEIASQRGLSLNSWIVQALRLATRERAIDVDSDLSSLPFGSNTGFGPRKQRRVQGWVR